ncbi:MAG: HD domain-containing protein [Myxococcales bacterium]|nr:MAG: HD domain-containing protein [Myxococcales bacterium]
MHIQRPLKNPIVLEQHLEKLISVIEKFGGKALLVGGCVRDHLLGITAKDFDIEVYGLESKALEEILSKNFSVYAVGKSFGIFKVSVQLNNEQKTFDVALPRRENKNGRGHKGFVVTTDPHMTFEEASSRRDFTINAMGIDTKNQSLIDPYDGEKALDQRILRHVSHAFIEDPLRVLRAAQFCARFNLLLHDDTIALCKSLKEELTSLSKERIFEEMKKLLFSPTPSIGLEILRNTEALILFPELEALIGCEQDPEWHPEGDVWIHSLMVTDEAAKICTDLPQDERLIVMAGALCHDLGKPSTTIFKDGHVKSPGHEQAGHEPTLLLLEHMGFPKKYYDDIACLVMEHLKPFQLYKKREEVSDGAIRRLCSRVNVDHLLMVSKADFLGRTSLEALSGFDPSEEWLKEKVKMIMGQIKKPSPIIQGRHLIALGMKPGKHFSPLLDQAFEAQLDGIFCNEEQGIEWLKNKLNKNKE